MKQRMRYMAAFCAALSLGLGGCGAEGPAGSSDASPREPAKIEIPKELAAQAAANPLAPYPSQTGNLPAVKTGMSVASLSFSAYIVALKMNFFEYLGVDAESITLQAGSTMLQSVTGGSIDMGDSASTELAGAVDKGLDLVAVQNTSMMTMQLCVSESWAESKGLSAEDSLEEKVAGLEGATFAITGPGSVSDTMMRFLLKQYGQLDPDSDVKLIQVGGASSFAPSLDAGRVDAFLLAAPSCAMSKSGVLLLQPNDVPEWEGYIHEVLYTTNSWLDKHADEATRVATAISMGNNFILKYPEAALKILQQEFSSVDPAVIADSFETSILPQIREDGIFEKSMWENLNTILTTGEFMEKALDVAEGDIWTNNFVDVEAASVH